jgi:23S rRNA pseudouridine1911/1915/1917 synthase
LPGAHPRPSEPSPEGRRLVQADSGIAGLRLDKALAAVFPDLSRSRIHSLIDVSAVLVNGQASKPAARVRRGDQLTVEIPAAVPSRLEPERGDVDIVFEDDHLLVVRKPAGVVVHPGAGVTRGTLAAALLAHCGSLSQVGGVTRPGIVHRLDKGTSGLLVVAKSDHAHRSLSAQFKGRTVTKIYAALCLGAPRPGRGSITLPIGRDPRHRQKMTVVKEGRAAQTDYEVTESFGGASALRLTLHTGRTHQIRVHLAALRCPLVGDSVYGASALAGRSPEPFRSLLSSFPRPALHAEVLGFTHPSSGERMRFEAPWPDDLGNLRAELRAMNNPGSEGS